MELNLARRPGWGGGALRAFRWAEIISDAVSFEICVGRVAGAMAVLSILFSFAVLVPFGSRDVPWGPLEGAYDFFISLF